MENASKALLIAGGVLLTMLIVSLLLFGYKSMTDYYANEEKLQAIEDVEKFNAQFIGFDRDDIYGNELITLVNKVSDYNFRYSNSDDAKNDLKYSPITIEIDFVDEVSGLPNRKQLSFDGNPKLFQQKRYSQSNSSNGIINIINESYKIGRIYGNDDIASKVARSINSLVWEKAKQTYSIQDYNDEQLRKIIVNTYNSLTNKNVTDYQTVRDAVEGNDKIYKYYEFYQFQRAVFKCTSFEHDDRTGRVSKLSFKFTGNLV